MEFKNYLLSEDKRYFGGKIGDILNSIQDLTDSVGNMNQRHMSRVTESICNEIRGVLRSNWSSLEKKHLESLQRIGVALMRAVNGEEDLKETLVSAKFELEKVAEKIGMPVNQMGSGVAGEDDS